MRASLFVTGFTKGLSMCLDSKYNISAFSFITTALQDVLDKNRDQINTR